MQIAESTAGASTRARQSTQTRGMDLDTHHIVSSDLASTESSRAGHVVQLLVSPASPSRENNE